MSTVPLERSSGLKVPANVCTASPPRQNRSFAPAKPRGHNNLHAKLTLKKAKPSIVYDNHCPASQSQGIGSRMHRTTKEPIHLRASCPTKPLGGSAKHDAMLLPTCLTLALDEHYGSKTTQSMNFGICINKQRPTTVVGLEVLYCGTLLPA